MRSLSGREGRGGEEPIARTRTSALRPPQRGAPPAAIWGRRGARDGAPRPPFCGRRRRAVGAPSGELPAPTSCLCLLLPRVGALPASFIYLFMSISHRLESCPSFNGFSSAEDVTSFGSLRVIAVLSRGTKAASIFIRVLLWEIKSDRCKAYLNNITVSCCQDLLHEFSP